LRRGEDAPTGFVELSASPRDPGVWVACGKYQVHVSNGFDSDVLTPCGRGADVTGPAATARIFLKRGATDMRKGFDGLSGLVYEAFGREPTDGSLFVFVSRRRDMIKALYWDRDGFALWSKRLERGRFAVSAEGSPEIGRAELALILEGVTACVIRRSPRWRFQ